MRRYCPGPSTTGICWTGGRTSTWRVISLHCKDSPVFRTPIRRYGRSATSGCSNWLDLSVSRSSTRRLTGRTINSSRDARPDSSCRPSGSHAVATSDCLVCQRRGLSLARAGACAASRRPRRIGSGARGLHRRSRARASHIRFRRDHRRGARLGLQLRGSDESSALQFRFLDLRQTPPNFHIRSMQFICRSSSCAPASCKTSASLTESLRSIFPTAPPS